MREAFRSAGGHVKSEWETEASFVSCEQKKKKYLMIADFQFPYFGQRWQIIMFLRTLGFFVRLPNKPKDDFIVSPSKGYCIVPQINQWKHLLTHTALLAAAFEVVTHCIAISMATPQMEIVFVIDRSSCCDRRDLRFKAFFKAGAQSPS